MAGKGGYERPTKPAAVSGPGKYSQRTDGGPGETPQQAARYISGGSYGEGQEMMDLQQGAPMSAAPGVPGAPMIPIPLNAPSGRPEEPLTAGMPFGPGVGPEGLPMVPPVDDLPVADEVSAHLRAMLLAYPSSRWLQVLVNRLNMEGR